VLRVAQKILLKFSQLGLSFSFSLRRDIPVVLTAFDSQRIALDRISLPNRALNLILFSYSPKIFRLISPTAAFP